MIFISIKDDSGKLIKVYCIEFTIYTAHFIHKSCAKGNIIMAA